MAQIKNSLIDDPYQIIDYVDVVDVVKHNTDIIKETYYFRPSTKSNTIIKWCRKNFGPRGDGWDFTAGTKGVEIKIWDSKLKTMWELWQE